MKDDKLYIDTIEGPLKDLKKKVSRFLEDVQ